MIISIVSNLPQTSTVNPDSFLEASIYCISAASLSLHCSFPYFDHSAAGLPLLFLSSVFTPRQVYTVCYPLTTLVELVGIASYMNENDMVHRECFCQKIIGIKWSSIKHELERSNNIIRTRYMLFDLYKHSVLFRAKTGACLMLMITFGATNRVPVFAFS